MARFLVDIGGNLIRIVRCALYYVYAVLVFISTTLDSLALKFITFDWFNGTDLYKYVTVFILAFLGLFIIIKAGKEVVLRIIGEGDNTLPLEKMITRFVIILACIVAIKPVFTLINSLVGTTITEMMQNLAASSSVARVANFATDSGAIVGQPIKDIVGKGNIYDLFSNWDNLMKLVPDPIFEKQGINIMDSNGKYIYFPNGQIFWAILFGFLEGYVSFMILLMSITKLIDIFQKLIFGTPLALSSLMSSNTEPFKNWYQLILVNLLSLVVTFGTKSIILPIFTSQTVIKGITGSENILINLLLEAVIMYAGVAIITKSCNDIAQLFGAHVAVNDASGDAARLMEDTPRAFKTLTTVTGLSKLSAPASKMATKIGKTVGGKAIGLGKAGGEKIVSGGKALGGKALSGIKNAVGLGGAAASAAGGAAAGVAANAASKAGSALSETVGKAASGVAKEYQNSQINKTLNDNIKATSNKQPDVDISSMNMNQQQSHLDKMVGSNGSRPEATSTVFGSNKNDAITEKLNKNVNSSKPTSTMSEQQKAIIRRKAIEARKGGK